MRPVQPAVFPHPPFGDYALLDSGGARKLERFGPIVLDRPDPQALWRPRRARDEWERAHLVFEREDDRGGRWRVSRDAPEVARGADAGRAEWTVGFGGARFVIRPTRFKHVGLFPEQAANWVWMAGRIAELRAGGADPPELLDLFGYTGAASLLAHAAGARVTHVDASKTALAWVRDNLAASEVGERALRLVLDDALAFARREARRGRRYAGVLLDPPHHGRGPKGETWRFEEGFAPLVEACAELLAERAFLVLSTYAIGYSPLAFTNALAGLDSGAAGDVAIEAGELALPEEGGDRLLPAGFCARWSRGLG